MRDTIVFERPLGVCGKEGSGKLVLCQLHEKKEY